MKMGSNTSYFLMGLCLCLFLLITVPSLKERREKRKTPLRMTASPTPSPTFTPTDPDKRPIITIWQTNQTYYGDMIGSYEKSTALCQGLAGEETALAFPLLGYTGKSMDDAAQRYDASGVPVYYLGQPLAMKWSAFLAYWTTTQFLDGLDHPIWTGFSSDYVLEANCGNWQDRFKDGMLSDEAIVPCGEQKHAFFCAKVTFV